MIIATLGKLSVAQAMTAGANQISTNVIQHAAIDYAALTDAWLSIDTVVAAGGSGAITFNLVLGDAVGLDSTNVSVVQIYIAAVTDKRVATAGRHITAINVGKVLKEMLDTDGSSYPYLGLLVTLASSATLTFNAALSPSEPPTEQHRMVTVSNVTVPSICSAGSGL